MKILVVDDDLELLGLVAFALRQAGYLVLEAPDGRAALQVFDAEQPRLVILDIGLPRMNGLEVLREIRRRGGSTAVMMLTARTDEQDQVGALDLGADDYLTKPFSPRTLLARVRALMRRSGSRSPEPLEVGSLVLDVEQQTVSVRGGEPAKLTRLEFRLLQLLLANAGHVLSADRLTTHVWGLRGMGDRQALKQLVHRLRGKLEIDPAAPRHVVTEPGLGYRLVAQPDGPDGAPPAGEPVGDAGE